MSAKNKLIEVCVAALRKKGLENEAHKERLKEELQELENQAEHEYFVDLYERKLKFPYNEHNLLVAYLLGLCGDFDISAPYAHFFGELPDIDVDYLPIVQPYIKNDWAIETFGRDYVCNIGNYNTFGIRAALIDMTRVHGKDRNEILALTTQLGMKDDEGSDLTWEKALEINPDLAAFCERNPEVADAAYRILDRVRGRGKHAGGLVISSTKIADLVPIMVDTDGNRVSGWTEGQHEQDLQPVGLVKFDVLAVKDLQRIVECCHLVKQRHGINSISAKPGLSDWTDTSYLNDPKALALANEGKLRGVFQFGSVGMINMVRRGGVTCFEDMAAYSALFRPGPLGMKMHDKYTERKTGREIGWERDIHPLIMPIVQKTYGVLVFQEQVMQILNVVGDVPLPHCEKVRKAMSKKRLEDFAHYKEMFMENGSRKLGWPMKSDSPKDTKNMEYLWNQIESFSGYGFCKAHATGYAVIALKLLYLRAHYPIEFFVTLLCSERVYKDLRTYKRDAEHEGISVKRINIDLSGENYEIIDEEIVCGFSNIRGVGVEPAKKIVANKPYTSFEDFLYRFGTDAKVLKPLIYLNTFPGDPALLEEFCVYFKEKMAKRKARDKGHFKTRAKYFAEVQELAEEKLDHDTIMGWYEEDVLDRPMKFWTVVKKYQRCVNIYEEKVANDEKFSLANFQSSGIFEPSITGTQFEIETMFYGFSWDHPIQKSPDYIGGLVFSRFEKEGIREGPVEVEIIRRPERKESTKKKGFFYYRIFVEDEDWTDLPIIFWLDDYEIFKEELEVWDEKIERGNFLRVRVRPPGKGYRSFVFESPPKNRRHIIPPKEEDYRLVVMKQPNNLEQLRG